MKIRNSLTAAALALLAFPATGSAQGSGRVTAPESIQSTPDQAQYYAITVHAYPLWNRDGSAEDGKWRRAEPHKDVPQYFTGAEPAFAALLADPGQPRLNARLDLTVGIDGRVTACTADERSQDQVELAASLCPLVTKTLTFMPALDFDRQPVTDRARFSFSIGHFRKRAGVQASAIQEPDPSPRPSPPYIPNFRDMKDWPPSSRYGLRRMRPNFRFPSAVETASAGGPSVQGEKVAGVTVFAVDHQTTGCETMVTSGDATFDERACEHVMKTSGPGFAGATYDSKRGYPLLVIGKRKPERIVAPAEQLAKWVSLSDAARDTFLAQFLPGFEAAGGDRKRMRLNFNVAADGTVSDCRIRSTSGSTAADIYACETVERILVYEPAIDAFGRPRDNVGVWWGVPRS